MKISKKIKNIMNVSAIIALLIFAQICAIHQTVLAVGSAGFQNSQNSNYGGSNPSQNSDFGPYMKRMQDKIKANWRPPVKEMDAQIVVKYRIMRDGTLDSYGILQSSGAQDLDNAAIDALRSASPFEPLPASFNKESILVQFTFDYQKPQSMGNNFPSESENRPIAPVQQNIPLSNRMVNSQPVQPLNNQIVSAQPLRPVNNNITTTPQNTQINQIAEFQPLVPVNSSRTSLEPVSIAGTPVAPIRLKAGPGEPIQVEKLPPMQKMFPPVQAVQSYEQTPATLAGSQQTIQKYVQAPNVAGPTQVTQVYVPTPPPPEILEPIQPPKAIVPLPPKNTDPRNVAVPPPIRQTPAVDITTYAQGDLLDLDGSKISKDGYGNQQPSYVFIPNRVEPPSSYPEVEYIRFENVEEVPVNTTLSTGINKVAVPTRRRKITKPAAYSEYPDVPEHHIVQAPVPTGRGKHVEEVRVPDFSEYMRKVERKITRKWHPPLSDYSTNVVVNYIIYKNGDLGNYYVSESSGNSRMDASAMEALKNAAPFPPLPKGYAKDSVEVKFTFDYNVYKNRFEKRGIKEFEEEDL